MYSSFSFLFFFSKNSMIPPYTIGLVSLVLVIVLWTASNCFISTGVAPPYLVNYISCGFLAVFMLFAFIPDPIQLYAAAVQRRKNKENPEEQLQKAEDTKKKEISWLEKTKLSAPFAVTYFGANYFNSAAFSLTYLSSATILSNASGLFSLIIGRLMQVEELSIFKFISVILTFLGVILLKVFEAQTEGASVPNPVRGNIYALIASFLYGCYSNYIKKVVGEGDNELVSGSVMFGLTGIYSLLLFWPGLLVLYVWKELPSINGELTLYLSLNALLGTVVANFAWNAAITFTSSVMVAVGLSFMAPVSVVIDYFRNPDEGIRWYKILSMLLMLIGFAFINLASMKPAWDRIILPTKKASAASSSSIKP